MRRDFAHYVDALTASDPGHLRLRAATRATLIAGIAAWALSELAARLGASSTATMLGVSVAMMASFSLNDADPRSQRVTLALVPLPAGAATALGSFVHGIPWLADCAFVVIMFGAVVVRRFGPRFFTLGMMAFLPYFFSLYFQPRPRDLPWVLTSLVVAVALGYAVRFYVLPDRTEVVLPHAVRALHARAANVLHRLAEYSRQGRWSARRARRLREEAAALNGASLDLEMTLEQLDPACLGGEERLRALRERLLELELSVERAGGALYRLFESGAFPNAHRLEVVAALSRARRAVRGALIHEAPPARLELGDESLESALAELGHYRPPELDRSAIAAACARELVMSGRPVAPSNQQQFEVRGLHPTTRQGIQAALAGALAIVAGHALSPTRWYWAVVAAFTVFNRSATLTETWARAWQRVLGTLIGIAGGFLLAKLVTGDRTLELVMLFAALFFGIYLFRVSYTWFVMCFTLLLALLYGLLGRYTPGVLLLRLEESAIGALAGALVATFVLPARASVRIRGKAIELLDSLARYLGRVAASSGSAAQGWIESAREVDRQWHELRSLAEAVVARPFRPRSVEAAAMESAASALVFYSRLLAGELQQDGVSPPIARRAALVRDRAEALRARLQAPPAARGTAPAPVPAALPESSPALRFLSRMDEVLLHWAPFAR